MSSTRSSIQILAKLLEGAGAVPVVNGVPLNEDTRRAFQLGYRAGLDAAAEKCLEESDAHRNAGVLNLHDSYLVAEVLTSIAVGIRALPVPGDKQ